MTKDEALKLALEALKPFSTPNWAGTGVDKANEAITAIKQALNDASHLAASVQECLVCNGMGFIDGVGAKCRRCGGRGLTLATTTAAAQRQWAGLTDEEAKKAFAEHNCDISKDLAGILARAIETKLKEKNGL